MKEPILESFLRKQRIKQILPYIKKYPGCRILDIGCGWEAKLLMSVEPYISHGIGIDFKAPTIKTKKIITISAFIQDDLPFDDGSFDLITMLAVLEHLNDPKRILQECARLLRPNGGLLITVPSRIAKPVLEFLAFKLKLVSSAEIHDHKRYYNRHDLEKLLLEVPGFELREHSYFQFGLNNRLFLAKVGASSYPIQPTYKSKSK